MTDFLTSPSWFPDYCKDDSSVVANFTSANVTAVRGRIATAFQNVRTAMRNAGYGDNAWTLLVQTYPSPIPAASGFRYGAERLHPAEHRRLRLLERRRRLGQRHRARRRSTAPSAPRSASPA